MRAAIAILSCLVPSLAHADDAAPCEVTYVTVPDGVKDVIDRWVADEPHCQGRIALRVIPTADGLFLFAERPDGTVHERLVPDLTAAGVLVASWVSDSWRVDRPRKKKRTKRREIEVRAVAVDEQPTEVETTVEIGRPLSERKRWLSLGGTLVAGAEGADLGFRLESDVIVYGGWKLGVAVQKLQDTVTIDHGGGIQQGQVNDWSAGALLSRTIRWGSWEVRGAAGIYAVTSKLHAEDFYQYTGTTTWTWDIDPAAAYELSLTIHRDIGDRWGLAVTAGSMYFTQTWHGKETDLWYDRMDVAAERVQSVLVGSLRRRI